MSLINFGRLKILISRGLAGGCENPHYRYVPFLFVVHYSNPDLSTT